MFFFLFWVLSFIRNMNRRKGLTSKISLSHLTVSSSEEFCFGSWAVSSLDFLSLGSKTRKRFSSGICIVNEEVCFWDLFLAFNGSCFVADTHHWKDLRCQFVFLAFCIPSHRLTPLLTPFFSKTVIFFFFLLSPNFFFLPPFWCQKVSSLLPFLSLSLSIYLSLFRNLKGNKPKEKNHVQVYWSKNSCGPY